jgi:peptide/nickel transport system substrate-binding protein/oligopeptide transport system substrate-binding protein
MWVFLLYGCGVFAPTRNTNGAAGVATALPTASESNTAIVRTDAPPDTLRWSLEGITEVQTLDPATAGDTASFTVLSLVYGGLVRFDEHLEIMPDGASDIQISQDGKEFTFTIREGLTFADGTPVQASDFAYSLNRVLQPATNSFSGPDQFGAIVGARDVSAGKTKEAAGIKVIDPQTLQIVLDQPIAYFLSQLASPYGYVMSQKLVESGAQWPDQAYGTGPYRVKEWKHGQSLLLEKNAHYWRGAPQTAYIFMPFNADSETAFQQYLAGQLDIMGNQQSPIPSNHVQEVEALPDFRSSAVLVTRYIGFNNAMPPFDNVDLRRAFAMSIDRAQLVGKVLADTAVPAERILPSGMLGTQLPIQPLGFDPSAAKDALAQAGFADGSRVPEVTLAYANEGDNARVAQALREMWQENLGVDVKLQSYQLNDFNNALDTTYYTPTEGLQFYFSVWGADYPDPQNFLSRQLRTGVRNNNGHFSDPRFDQLVEEADRMNARSQYQQRLQLYNQAEQIAISRVGWLPLYYPKFNVLIRPRVEGLILTPNGILAPDWSKVRLEGS